MILVKPAALSGARLRAAGAVGLDQGSTAGAHVLAAGRAMAFFNDVNPAATSLMRTGEHGAFAVLRHPGHATPVDLDALSNQTVHCAGRFQQCSDTGSTSDSRPSQEKA